MKKSLFLIRLIISLVILGSLLYYIGIKKILVTLSNINLLVLLIAVPLYILVVMIGAFNIYILIKGLGKKLKIKDITKYTFIGWSLGLYMPSKVGEFSLPLFLKKQKVPVGKTVAVVLIDMIITLAVLTVMGFIGLVTLLEIKIKNMLLFSVIIIFIALITYFTTISRYGRSIIRRYILKKYSKIFTGFYKSMIIIIKNKRILCINAVLTVLKFIISSVITLTLFLALDEKVQLTPIILITALTVLIATIPITINGLGLRESSAVYFYSLINVKPEAVFAVYLIHTLIHYFISIITLNIFSKDLIEIKKSFKEIVKNKN